MSIHPRHEEARYQMARRLSRFFYDNRFGSDWVALAGEKFWSRVPKTAGEKHTPSPETRHLILEMLKDLEDAGAARGPSLEEIAGERSEPSWAVPSPDTLSGGPSPNPGQQDNTVDFGRPPVGPSDSSEAPAAGTQVKHEGRKGLPASSPLAVASEDAAVPAGLNLSETQRERQASFFPPFQPHSETSRSAARAIKSRTDTLRLQVLNLLRERGPMTDEAIAQALNLPQNTARPRRVELMQMGSVEARGKASTASGRKAVTWGVREAVSA